MMEMHEIEKEITPADYQKIKDEVQKTVDAKFKAMVGHGPTYVGTSSEGKTYPMLGLCGFAWIKFKGVKAKNMLARAGFKVGKAYGGGFTLDTDDLYDCPGWAIELNSEAGAYYGQSVDLKKVAAEAVLKILKDEFGFEGYVESRLD